MWKMSMWNALKANWNFINSKIVAFDWCITMLVRSRRVERSTVWSQLICWKLEIFWTANMKLLKLQQVENIWIKTFVGGSTESVMCSFQMRSLFFFLPPRRWICAVVRLSRTLQHKAQISCRKITLNTSNRLRLSSFTDCPSNPDCACVVGGKWHLTFFQTAKRDKRFSMLYRYRLYRCPYPPLVIPLQSADGELHF